ncbi:MAG: gliding motility-associated C-terminal domain-containing protein, partial [Bacteroidota bacterium]
SQTCFADETGVFIDTLQNHYGCDSFVIETVSLYPGSDTSYYTDVVCDPVQATNDTVTIRTPFGCEKVIIVSAFYGGTDTLLVDNTSCNPAAVGLDTVVYAGQFCDSVVITNTTLVATDTVFTQSYTCEVNEVRIDTSIYAGQFCDSVVINTVVLVYENDIQVSRTTCDPSEAGTFNYQYQNQYGCDSLVTETITWVASDTLYFERETCDPAQAGVLTTFYQNQYGCDSIIIETLSLVAPDTTYLMSETCDASQAGRLVTIYSQPNSCDSVVVHDVNLLVLDTTYLSYSTCDTAEVGILTTTYQNAAGCDSVVVAETNLLPTDWILLSGTTCDPSEAGTFTEVLVNRYGCDSVVVSEMIYVERDTSYQYASTCDSTASGTFTTILQNEAGCDSLLIEIVELLPQDTTLLTSLVCDSIEAGVFTEILQNQYGCDSTVIREVAWAESFFLETEVSICSGDSMWLEGAYQTQAGTYSDTYTSSAGCDSTVLTQLVLLPGSSLTLEDRYICRGDTAILAVEGNFSNISWISNGDLSCTDCPTQIVAPTSTTLYSVSTINCEGQEIVANATIFVDQPPSVNIIEEQMLDSDSTKLIAQVDRSVVHYEWAGPGVTCPNCEAIMVSPNRTSTFQLMGESEAGCRDTDEVQIQVEDNCVNGLPLVANIIMPDGDGYNDYLELQYEEIVSIEVLRVYNRWGELVFETNDMNIKWDATFRGELVNPGVYVYYVSGKCPNEEEFFRKGNVTVLY